MKYRQAYSIVVGSILVVSGCESNPSAPDPGVSARAQITPGSVTVSDVSGGIDGGVGVRTVSATGIGLGKVGSYRSWWSSGGVTPNILDGGYVNGGNRNADAAGGVGNVLLSTNGSAPWTDVALALPPGSTAGQTVPEDINDLRQIVGFAVNGSAYFWSSPSSAPEQLAPPSSSQYARVVARAINNNGTIVGYGLANLPKNKQRYEAIIWTNGIAALLPFPAGVKSQLASNINDAGVISGIADGVHPIRWTPRTDGGYEVAVASVDVGIANLETAIDNCGRIGGGSDLGAWVWDGASAPAYLPAIAGAGQWGVVRDINESGIAVGTSTYSNTRKTGRIQRATVWAGLGSCVP